MESNHELRIKWKNHQNEIMHQFSQFMKKNILTDCVLITKGGMLRAHKIVLAAASSYFYDLFLSHGNDPSNFSQMYNVDTIGYWDMFKILNYIYYGEVTVGLELVNRFLDTGRMLGIRGIKEFEVEVAERKIQRPKINEEVKKTRQRAEKAIKIEEQEMEHNVTIRLSTEVEQDLLIPLNNVKTCMSEMNCTNANDTRNATSKVENKNLQNATSKDKINDTQNMISKVEKPWNRRDTSTRVLCKFCTRPYLSNFVTSHEKNCFMNPDRKRTYCNICQTEVKPGSMQQHKMKAHNYVPKRRKTMDPRQINEAFKIEF